MMRTLALLLLVLSCACGVPLEQYEGELTRCDDNPDDIDAVLILDRQVGQPLAGWFGFAPAGTRAYLLAPMEGVDESGGELTFTAEFDFGGGNTPAEMDATMERSGEAYEGEVDVESGTSTMRCDVELALD